MFEDTIAAIATPLGAGGLAVLRVSGPRACAVADRCFVPAGRHALLPSAAPTHTLHYGHIVAAGRRVDEVMLAVMRAPRTFTREDVVEISCHGGVLPARLVLDALLAAGARAAEPGEFTRRAFVNGRIDLTQAEAVADVIHSRTELALAAANEQLAGHLSRRIEQLRADLLHVLAHVEAHIDFPDEDISPATRTVLLDRLDRGLALTDELLRTAPEGQLLRRGVRAAIIGRPNSGKSSLLNQLLGHNRAIVSPVAGTTRDTIEETANIRGVPVVFIDTAGLRAAGDEIEAEGIRRSRAALQQAPQRGQCFADAGGVADLAILERHIQIRPQEDPVAFDVEIAHGLEAHDRSLDRANIPFSLKIEGVAMPSRRSRSNEGCPQ